MENQASNSKKLGKIILTSFEGAQKSIKLYPSGHPMIKQSLSELMQALAGSFESLGKVNLNIIRNELYLNDAPLKEESMLHSDFIQQCLKRNVSSIKILSRINFAEMEKFLTILSQDVEHINEMGGINKLVHSERLSNIEVGQILPYISTVKRDGETEDAPELKGLTGREAYKSAVDAFRTVCADIDSNYISIKTIRATIQSLIENVLHNKEAMAELINLKHLDDYTFHHSVNVALLSVLIGSALKLNREELNLLGEAAILHDIGKLLVPWEVINKPDKLSDEEWEQIKLHPVNGARVLSEIKGISDICIIGAFEHHIRYDLKGYPTIKEKIEGHLFGQIIAIADTYDAVTSDRAYRKAFLPDDAFKIILKCCGNSLNPNIAKLFINLIGCYPLGCLVELDSNEIAIVCEINHFNLLRPKVKILLSAEGHQSNQEVVDLAELNEATDEPKRSIIKALDPHNYGIEIGEYL